jgi:hypothetical protein
MATTVVVFRKWKDSGDVIALFPEEPSDINGWYCDAYEHVGQHGGADYFGGIRLTRPASAAESAALAEELTRIGYKLKSIKRASARHHERRRDAAKAFRLTDTR